MFLEEFDISQDNFKGVW